MTPAMSPVPPKGETAATASALAGREHNRYPPLPRVAIAGRRLDAGLSAVNAMSMALCMNRLLVVCFDRLVVSAQSNPDHPRRVASPVQME